MLKLIAKSIFLIICSNMLFIWDKKYIFMYYTSPGVVNQHVSNGVLNREISLPVRPRVKIVNHNSS